MGLDFDILRVTNIRRCEDVFEDLNEWSPADWMTALAGEVGEAANLLKKRRRGEAVRTWDIARELADTVIYLDLLSARLGIDLGQAVIDKFNEVSEKRGSRYRLKG